MMLNLRHSSLIGLALLVPVLMACGNRSSPEPTSAPPAAADEQAPAQLAANDLAAPIIAVEPVPAAADSDAVDPVSDASSRSTQSSQATTYVVQPGDTLWSIAIAHHIDLETLMVANGIEDPNVIWVGQELVIPGAVQDTITQSRRETATDGPPATPTPPPSQPADPSASSETSSAPTLRPVTAQALLEPMSHEWQRLNNCAPVTIGMALSYYGRQLTQFDIAPVVKGGPQDKNVSPWEVVDYLQDQGFGAVIRVNGDLEMLQRLVSNGIPVMVEQWLDRPDDELTGHYRLVRGYDQATQVMIVNDSYNGPMLRFAYAEFDRLWRPFNRLYIPIYRPEDEPLVQAILDGDWDDRPMYTRAAEVAQAEIDSVGDAYAWFNLGDSYLGLEQYEPAAAAFDRAIEIGLPLRMFWYQFGAFEAYNQTGQYQKVLDLSAPLTGLALEELHYQRGVAYEGLGQPQLALAEYQKALEYNDRLMRAAEAVKVLADAGGGS